MSGALRQAAENAEAELAALWLEAERAMTLEGTSGLLYDVATDAIEAYERAAERAREIRLLADHDSGAYNAWTES